MSASVAEQAEALFNNYFDMPPRAFAALLVQQGWSQPAHKGSADIFLKDGCPHVFKLDDQSNMNTGYTVLARHLVQLNPDERSNYPHLPHIYGHRAGITLLERLQPRSPEDVGEWGANVIKVSSLITRGVKLEEESGAIGEFIRLYKTIPDTLRLLHQLAKRSGADIVAFKHDILMREDGTFVMVDPLL